MIAQKEGIWRQVASEQFAVQQAGIRKFGIRQNLPAPNMNAENKLMSPLTFLSNIVSAGRGHSIWFWSEKSRAGLGLKNADSGRAWKMRAWVWLGLYTAGFFGPWC
jgi:hypothetical protein